MSSPTPLDTSTPTAVVPGLYIGDKRLAANKDVLHALGITHIVNVTHDVRHYFESEPHAFTYLRCPCHDTDTADLFPCFTPACHFLHSALAAGHSALVHCQQGISRSAAIATAYLIRHHGLSLRDAYVRVKASRPAVKVNANFLKQLIRWERQCRDEDEQARRKREALTEGEQHKQGTTEATEGTAERESNKRKRGQQETGEAAAEGHERKEVNGAEQKQPEDGLQSTDQRVGRDVDGGGIEVNKVHGQDEGKEIGLSKRQKGLREPAAELSLQASSPVQQTDGGRIEAAR